MTDLAKIKERTYAQLQTLASGACPSTVYPECAAFWGVHPYNESVGLDAIRGVWGELRAALPDMERHDSIFIVGACEPDPRWENDLEGQSLVAAMGHFRGTFQRDLCGIPATGSAITIRYCEAHHVCDGKIAKTYFFIDLLDVMRQASVWPIAPSLGREGVWPGPATNDGVNLQHCDSKSGKVAFDTVMAMHKALLSFDGKSLASMSHGRYWDDQFYWYGPAGIGTTKGMVNFQAHHQIPFLTGFPDRAGPGHFIRIAEGDYVATGGWPSVVGTHTGEWLGMPPTGKHIEMRVMDFYRLSGGKIVENWVPIDILHILKQMGVDVLARLKHIRGDAKLDL